MFTVIYYDGNQNRLLRTNAYNNAKELEVFIKNTGHDVVIIIEGKPTIWLRLYGDELEEIPPSCMSD